MGHTSPSPLEKESRWRGWLQRLLSGKTVLVCFLGSLVSHCPVFPPWLWSHWPLFGDTLPQEPSLALPSPSPSQFFQTHSEREHRPHKPSHLLGSPLVRSPSTLIHSVNMYRAPTLCQTLAWETERTSLHALEASPARKRGTPGATVPRPWELLTASEPVR